MSKLYASSHNHITHFACAVEYPCIGMVSYLLFKSGMHLTFQRHSLYLVYKCELLDRGSRCFITDVQAQALLLQSVDRLVTQSVCYFFVLHSCAVSGNNRVVTGLLVRAFYPVGSSAGSSQLPGLPGNYNCNPTE